MMDLRLLRTEADYDSALTAIAAYFEDEPAPGSPEADRFDLLALLIADYESRHWAIEPPDAPDLLRAEMERRGLKQTDLARVLGSKARASEVLNRQRHLTLQQAWRLHVEWHIPTDALIRPYPLRPAKRRPRGPAAA